MTVSIVVIAHNEEPYIGACIESLLAQTYLPDEIIVINHNSIDATGDIARTYKDVKVVDLNGEKGSVFARIRGFEVAQGDYILCIDGDSIAASNWVEVLSGLLAENKRVMVGSWIRMSGPFYFHFGSLCWYFMSPSKGHKATEYLWGASLGIQGAKRRIAIEALRQGNLLSHKLQLSYNPDDYWLALFMFREGNVEVTNKTWVIAHAKETTSWQGFLRGIKAGNVSKGIQAYVKKEGLPNLAPG
jgi:glycosyltransferase involved in cell wall biosynthesis